MRNTIPLGASNPAAGPDHPDILAARGNLALILLRRGRLEEAEAVGRAVLENKTRVLGPDHPDTLANGARLVRGELYVAQVEMPARIFWVPGVASRAAGRPPAAGERTCAEDAGLRARRNGVRRAGSRWAAAWRGCL